MFYIFINKIKQQITENEVNLFFVKEIPQVSVVTLNPLYTDGFLSLYDVYKLEMFPRRYRGVTVDNFEIAYSYYIALSEDSFSLSKQCLLCFVRVCLYVLRGHLLGKG